MKRQIRIPARLLAVGSALLLATGALATGLSANAAHFPTVSLGQADGFAVLAGSGITNTGSTVITGDIGSFPTTTITGFPPGLVNGTNRGGDAVTQQAKTDLTAAYLDAAGRTPVTTIPTELGGTTLIPGVYSSLSGTFGLTGNVTLDGQGEASAVFVFKTASTLITATGSTVTLSRGTQSCNVFWQVGSSVTLGGSTTFRGSLLALTSITLVTGASIDGRALARNGAVTLDTNVITRSTCAAAAPPPVATATPVPTVAPTATPAPVATATPVPTPAPVATPAPTASPTPRPALLPSSSTQGRDDPPPAVFVLSLAVLALLLMSAMLVRKRMRARVA